MKQLLTKERQIHNELVSLLENGTVISEFELHKYLRDIERNSCGSFLTYLQAISYGLADKKEEAIRLFESISLSGNPLFMSNYVAYLDKRSNFPKWKEQVEIGAQKFNEIKSFLFSAFQANEICCNIKVAEKYLCRYIELCGSGSNESEWAANSLMNSKRMLSEFLKNSGLNANELQLAINAVMEVLQKYDLNIFKTDYVFGLPHDNTVNLYEFKLNTKDADLLADMNMALSYRLAEYDVLLGKKFSIWLTGMESIECR